MAALLYVSKSNLELPRDAAEVDDIVAVAQSRNADLQVTGALVFTEWNFAQYLEGPQASLGALMDSIMRDRRHRDVDVVLSSGSEVRRFETWAMAYAGPSSFVARHVFPLIGAKPGPERDRASERLILLMREFVMAQSKN